MPIIFHIAVVFTAAILASAATSKFCISRWGGSFPRLCTIGCLLTAVAIAGSVFLHGLGMHNIQTVFLCCVFLYASYGDIRTHEADCFVHVIVLAVALMNKTAAEVPAALLSALLTFGILFLVAMFVPGAGIGGADIWFSVACAFLTNVMGSLWGLGLGTFAALLCNSPFRKKAEGQSQPFPMLPFFSCSYMIVYLLSW